MVFFALGADQDKSVIDTQIRRIAQNLRDITKLL